MDDGHVRKLRAQNRRVDSCDPVVGVPGAELSRIVKAEDVDVSSVDEVVREDALTSAAEWHKADSLSRCE